MAIGSHHQDRARRGGNDIGDYRLWLPLPQRLRELMPGKRVGGTIEQRSVTRIVRTGDHDVHWHVGEQRRVRATLERPTRGGAAVVSEHGDLRRLDRACGDQDWLGTPEIGRAGGRERRVSNVWI